MQSRLDELSRVVCTDGIDLTTEKPNLTATRLLDGVVDTLNITYTLCEFDPYDEYPWKFAVSCCDTWEHWLDAMEDVVGSLDAILNESRWYS